MSSVFRTERGPLLQESILGFERCVCSQRSEVEKHLEANQREQIEGLFRRTEKLSKRANRQVRLSCLASR